MPDIQSSFIPKQVLTPDLRARKQPVGLFLLLSVVVLIISVLFLGGVYAYKFKINDDINGACPTDDPNDTNGCGLIASIAKV